MTARIFDFCAAREEKIRASQKARSSVSVPKGYYHTRLFFRPFRWSYRPQKNT